jgi:hypothetical protein
MEVEEALVLVALVNLVLMEEMVVWEEVEVEEELMMVGEVEMVVVMEFNQEAMEGYLIRVFQHLAVVLVNSEEEEEQEIAVLKVMLLAMEDQEEIMEDLEVFQQVVVYLAEEEVAEGIMEVEVAEVEILLVKVEAAMDVSF